MAYTVGTFDKGLVGLFYERDTLITPTPDLVTISIGEHGYFANFIPVEADTNGGNGGSVRPDFGQLWPR